MGRREKHKKRIAGKYSEIILSPARAFLHEFSILTGSISGWHPMGLAEYEDKLLAQERQEHRARIRDAKRRKWIETKKIGERLLIRLTARGWQQALRDQIRCTKAKCGNGLCIVIFDVPESERHVRAILRDILKSCNFSMVQKSVWASDRDVVRPLCALLQGAKLEKWVQILVGQKIHTRAILRAITRAGK